MLAASAAVAAIAGLQPVMAGEQEAIDGCIDQLRAVGGPDGRAGGQVLSSEFSEAATLVMLRDAGGTVWRCLAYSDGTVGELTVRQAADDGGGAMAGASGYSTQEPATSTERVRFDRGSSGAELTATLTPGSSIRYVLNAKNGQELYVRVASRGLDVYYQIFNPDGSFLLEQMDSAREYRGELWQSGDHVIEVINRGNRNTSYNVIFGIE
ncbi:MAG TPA: hypothetical protein VLM41_11335 [Steroidobacteraceae bacterium]|nr:hypothetical protein [Steroidobacteraceae bacterium]